MDQNFNPNRFYKMHQAHTVWTIIVPINKCLQKIFKIKLIYFLICIQIKHWIFSQKQHKEKLISKKKMKNGSYLIRSSYICFQNAVQNFVYDSKRFVRKKSKGDKLVVVNSSSNWNTYLLNSQLVTNRMKLKTKIFLTKLRRTDASQEQQ
jgi:hypothetical protein